MIADALSTLDRTLLEEAAAGSESVMHRYLNIDVQTDTSGSDKLIHTALALPSRPATIVYLAYLLVVWPRRLWRTRASKRVGLVCAHMREGNEQLLEHGSCWLTLSARVACAWLVNTARRMHDPYRP